MGGVPATAVVFDCRVERDSRAFAISSGAGTDVNSCYFVMNQTVGTKAATNAEGGGVGHGDTNLNCVLLTNRQARVALS